MTKRSHIEHAIAVIESLRTEIGDVAADAAQEGLRHRLSEGADIPESGALTLDPVNFPAERKIVTVMFADITGFTALSESMDPEALRDIINACFEELTPIVEKYFGVVDKFIGDEIMALFGAPLAHEHSPRNALSAALEMQSALEVFNTNRGLSLGLHFGINTGPVIAGGIGTPRRRQYSVMGDAVNVAARLADKSERGEILTGPETYRLTSAFFQFETLAPLRLKGKSRPVRAYRLLGARARPERGDTTFHMGTELPFTGREVELNAVLDRLEALIKGRGGILGVIGEAGLGKTRLLDEAYQRLEEKHPDAPVLRLEGRTLTFGRMTSFRPFQEILRQYTNIAEDEDTHTARGKFEHRVHALLGDEASVMYPYLARVMGLPLTDEQEQRIRHLDSQAVHSQIFIAMRRLFERLASTRPVMLVLEDLHWVDESSVQLLEHLLPLVERYPLLICGLSRPDADTPAEAVRERISAQQAHLYTQVRLAPLPENISEELAKGILDMKTVSPRVRELVIGKAEGNPFFLEEILRSLIETGDVEWDPDRKLWIFAKDFELITIPSTIRGVILARVDRLDERVKGVLKTAAVIGRSFLYRILCACEQAEQGLEKPLNDLVQTDLILFKSTAPELEYMFKHALTQEATYESILMQTRRKLHERVGTAIEELFADRLDDFYSLLAYHYAQAANRAKAQEYLVKAGSRAENTAADAEALLHYQEALKIYESSVPDAWNRLERASLERRLGEALFRRGEHVSALTHLERALSFLGNPLPSSRWKVVPGILREILSQTCRRLLPGSFSHEDDREPDVALQEELSLYETIGWIDAFRSNDRLLLVALRALNTAERNGYTYGIATGSMALGTIGDLLALFRLGAYYHGRAVRSAGQTGNATAIGLARTGQALHNICLGRWDEAKLHGRQSADVYNNADDMHGWGYATYMEAVAEAYQGNFSDALSLAAAMDRMGEEGDDPHVRCWGKAVRGFVSRFTGDWDTALSEMAEAGVLAEQVHDYAIRIWAGVETARVRLRQDRLSEALEILEETRQYRETHDKISLVWVAYENPIAEVRLAAASAAQGTDRARLMKKAKHACRDAIRQAKKFRGLMPEAMRLLGHHQWLTGHSSRAQQTWRSAADLSEKTGQRYDHAAALIEIGRHTDDAPVIEMGRSLLTNMQAHYQPTIGDGQSDK
jgi:class 3 adenylate cyclase/tetratricopeptide (TPR) repeat protein